MRYFAAICLTIGLAIPATLRATQLEAALKNNLFYSPGIGSYVESDLLILGNSISYTKNANGKYSGEVDVVTLYKKGTEIIAYDKYTLHTVDIDDTNHIGVGIVDQRRYALPYGTYVVEMTLTDRNNHAQKILTKPLLVDLDQTHTSLSSIALIDTYVKADENGNSAADGKPLNKDYIKSGLYMTPLILNLYANNQNNLLFYAEAYNCQLSKDSQLLANYSIKKDGETTPIKGLSSFKKITAKPVVPLFGEFDISQLPTGNYNLFIELKDRNNVLVCLKKVFFQRVKISERTAEDLAREQANGNAINELDIPSLHYQLKTFWPIANVNEWATIEELQKQNNRDTLLNFINRFWTSRDSVSPINAWANYEEQVKQANNQFGTSINYGFETDRGRVYLKYGPPNQLTDMPHEPSAYPYQIWQYYNIPSQGAVKFVFYTHNRVTNEYELIHSTALNEIRNEQWQRLVYQGTGTVSPTDYGTQIEDHFGSKATERYVNP